MKLSKLLLLPMCVMAALAITSCSLDLEDDGVFDQEERTAPYKFTEGFKDNVAYPLTDGIKGSDWMSRLSDDTKVCKLSIPGTHDALTGMGFYNKDLKYIFNLTAISQVSTLYQQLECGVRFFDIRPVVSTDTINHEKVLRCTHGFSEIAVTLEECLDMLSLFLEEHPGEFVIVKLQVDSGAENQVDWVEMMQELLEEYNTMINPGVFAEWHPGLTVGETRGKILFINRRPFLGMYGAYCEYPDEDADIDEEVHLDDEMSNIMGPAEDDFDPDHYATAYVQDYYKTTTKLRQLTKVEAVLNMMHEARECTKNPDDNTWIINHCSAYTSVSPHGYVTNAEIVHPEAIKDILQHPKEPVGIVAIDFACYDNVNVIINGYTPYTSDYLFNKKPMSQSLTNLLIMSNFK